MVLRREAIEERLKELDQIIQELGKYVREKLMADSHLEARRELCRQSHPWKT